MGILGELETVSPKKRRRKKETYDPGQSSFDEFGSELPGPGSTPLADSEAVSTPHAVPPVTSIVEMVQETLDELDRVRRPLRAQNRICKTGQCSDACFLKPDRWMAVPSQKYWGRLIVNCRRCGKFIGYRLEPAKK